MASIKLETDIQRAALSIREKPYWQFLEPNRHLGIVVRRQQVWVARCRRIGGDYVMSRLGVAAPAPGGLSFDAARAAAEVWFEEQRARKFAQDPHQARYNGQLTICPVGSEITIGHALHSYIEWKRIAAARSHFSSCLILVNFHLVPRLANLPIAEFNGVHFQAFCRDILETPPKYGARRLGARREIASLDTEELRKRKKTLNTLISILRVAFALSWERGEIDTDRPIRCLRHLPNYDRPRAIYLDRGECHRLVEAADPVLRPLITGALYTGCRVSELIAMNIEDVGAGGPGVHIRHPKNYRSRFVFLPGEGLAQFKAWCRGKVSGDPVFTNRLGRRWGDQYKYLFTKAVAGAGLSPRVVFHGLRHTYASQLIEAGTPLSVVARQLGHSDTKTVEQTYSHLIPQTTAAEIEARFEPLEHRATACEPGSKGKSDRRRLSMELPDHSNQGEPAWPRSNASRHQGAFAGLASQATKNRCLVPGIDSVIHLKEWKKVVGDKFVTEAPRPRTPSKKQYSDRKLRLRD